MDSTSTERSDIINAFANKVFTNGLPDSQTGGEFTLVINVYDSGVDSAVALKDGNGNLVYPESSDDDNSSSSTATPKYGFATEYDSCAFNVLIGICIRDDDEEKANYLLEHYEFTIINTYDSGSGIYDITGYKFKG